MGIESPKDLIEHFIAAVKLCIDPEYPGYSDKFLGLTERNNLIKEIYLDIHTRYIEASLN